MAKKYLRGIKLSNRVGLTRSGCMCSDSGDPGCRIRSSDQTLMFAFHG